MVSLKRSRADAAPSRTLIVTAFTGRLVGVPEQLGGGPAEKVPMAQVHEPSTCIQ